MLLHERARLVQLLERLPDAEDAVVEGLGDGRPDQQAGGHLQDAHPARPVRVEDGSQRP